MSSSRSGRKTWLVAFVTAAVTVCAIVIALNFVGGKTVEPRPIPHLYSVHDSAFARAMALGLGPSIVGGNLITDLQNGDQIFPAMLDAIQQAQKTITFESYIFWAGGVGRKFAIALSERARAGVKVHVLVDWAGSYKIDASDVAMMQHAGVSFREFRPLRWYTLTRVNKRTHRKLLVVDGRVGFIGGVAIADEWTGHGEDSTHWRDSQYRVAGPVVAQMQASFMENWTEVTGEVLEGDDYFPLLTAAGPSAAQLSYSSPTTGGGNMELTYLLAIAAAEHSIELSSAYFVPDAQTEAALTSALKRGVRVEIVTVGKYTDSKVVRGASRSRWGPVLAAGAQIYEYGPAMYHCKAFIVDDLLVSMGSANWDPRSFGLNDEANLVVYDADFARRQADVFRGDLAKSHRVTLAEWQARSLREKLRERLESLLGRSL